MNMGDPDPVVALRASSDFGLKAGTACLEIYEPDIANPAMQDTLHDVHASL